MTQALCLRLLLCGSFLFTSMGLSSCSASENDVAARALRVFAAASLRDAFDDVKRAFERRHPGISVQLVFAGSQVLRLQIEHGARADVFASAHLEHLIALQQLERTAAPQVFAQNSLAVLVPAASPLTSFSELTSIRRLVVGDPTSPIGRYTDELWRRARTQIGDDFVNDALKNIASRESNARLLRAKVELGAAQAAIAYQSDATSSEGVRTLTLPKGLNVRVDYHVATGASPSKAARDFVSFLRSPEGRIVLRRHGLMTDVP